MEEKLATTFSRILEGLAPDKVSKEYGYYASLIGDDVSGPGRSKEQRLAKAAIQYPALRGPMRDVVETIIALNNRPFTQPLWESDEEQAGSALALELALTDKADVLLYARHLATNDLDHEVYQSDDLAELIETWGFCKEIYGALASRIGGQHGDEFFEEYEDELKESFESPGALNDFIEMFARRFTEDWRANIPLVFYRDLLDPLFSLLFGTPSCDDYWEEHDGDEDYKEGDEYSDMVKGFLAAVGEGKIPTYSEINPE